MKAHEIVTGSILVTSAISCWFLCWIITSYLLKKPLGKQTLLDKFIIEFLKSYVLLVSVTNFLFYFMAIPLPFTDDQAQSSFYLANFALDYFLIWLISVVFIKYVIIFHRHWLDLDKTDSEIMYLAKIFNWIIFLILFCTEHLIIEEIHSSAFYQFLLNENKAPEKFRSIPKTTVVLVIIAILMIAKLQIRMEITGMKKIPPRKLKKHNKILVRFIATLISTTISYVMYALATVELEDLFTRLTHGCIVPIFTAVVPPALFIFNNPNMTKFAKNLLTI